MCIRDSDNAGHWSNNGEWVNYHYIKKESTKVLTDSSGRRSWSVSSGCSSPVSYTHLFLISSAILGPNTSYSNKVSKYLSSCCITLFLKLRISDNTKHLSV